MMSGFGIASMILTPCQTQSVLTCSPFVECFALLLS